MNMRHNPELVENLQKRLSSLSRQHGVIALKTGTEVEDMDGTEIAVLRQISAAAGLPLVVKIGGPEARRDMRECLALGVDVLLAPMVESVYALVNFVDTAKSIMRETGKEARLAINLETGLAVQNLDAMIATSAFAQLSHVTIGRGDLSKSMNLSVDDEEVLTVTRNTLVRLNRQNKVTSVGGGLSVHNISTMAELLPSARFNTRHIVFENSAAFSRDAARNLSEGLYFEQAMYEAFAIMNPERAAFYAERNRQLEERLPRLRIRRTAAM
jgi:citrate lyase beta subunit